MVSNTKHKHFKLVNEVEGCNFEFKTAFEVNKQLQTCLAKCQAKYKKTPCRIFKEFQNGAVREIINLPESIVGIEIECTLTSDFGIKYGTAN